MVARRRLLRHAADEKTGVAAILPQQEGRERRGGGLAMSAGDDDVSPALQDVIREEGRKGGKRQGPGIEQPLHFGITAGNRIAYDHEVGLQALQTGRLEAFVQRDTGRSQYRAHRRIHIGIRPGHLVPGVPGQQGGIAHGSTADSHEVKFHLIQILPNRFFRVKIAHSVFLMLST